ncbi:MAG: polysaccharide biosynthesis/export family protein, partial [candidate division WOR-3 bacterium]
MILLFFIAQITSETQKIIYYEVPSKFIPYISSSKAYMVPENYKIRKGDILHIIFFGTYNQVYIQQVTNTGEIWIITTPTSLKFSSSPLTEPLTEVSGPNLGFFKVDGKTLKEIEEEINKKIKEKFEG